MILEYFQDRESLESSNGDPEEKDLEEARISDSSDSEPSLGIESVLLPHPGRKNPFYKATATPESRKKEVEELRQLART